MIENLHVADPNNWEFMSYYCVVVAALAQQ